MISQRDYYLLSIDIFKTLSLSPEHRPIPSKDFLEKSYNTYTKLIESSSTLARVKGDQLIPIDLPTNEDEIEVLTPQSNGVFWNTVVTAPHSELRSAE
jgi:hypothetical protein